MYTPISEEEMYRLMEESCRGNKTGETDFGFVPFTPSEVEEFLKEQED